MCPACRERSLQDPKTMVWAQDVARFACPSCQAPLQFSRRSERLLALCVHTIVLTVLLGALVTYLTTDFLGQAVWVIGGVVTLGLLVYQGRFPRVERGV